jgi:peptidyl-prolyl cis-trans isomerase SurA
MNLRLQGRVRVSEDEMRAAYRKLVLEERKQLPFRIATIVMDAGDASRRARAEKIATRARAGEDFAKLVQRHSTDTSSATTGGLLPAMQPGKLPPALDRAVLDLEAGEVAAPVRVGDRWIIAQLVERGASKLPSYDVARPELQQRVYVQKMDSARQHWLENLRRRTYVDIRL